MREGKQSRQSKLIKVPTTRHLTNIVCIAHISIQYNGIMPTSAGMSPDDLL